MNYYEFAPPIFRWFMNPETKPWEMFKTFWIILVLAMITLLVLGWYYQKKKPKQKLGHIAFYVVWLVLLYHVIIADKHYLDYEFEKACQTAGIYITKQVEAEGYAETDYMSAPILSTDELKTLKDLKSEKGDYSVWETLDEKQCDNQEYSFSEQISLDRLQSGKLYFYERFKFSNKILDGKGKSKRYDYVSRYSGEKDGQCVTGYLSNPLSRYFAINDEGERIGLGVTRYEEYIVDTQTGEKIAYTVRFITGTYILKGLVLGGFGEIKNYCRNEDIKSPLAKEYRKPPKEQETTIKKMIRFTLIPKRYFQGNDQ